MFSALGLEKDERCAEVAIERHCIRTDGNRTENQRIIEFQHGAAIGRPQDGRYGKRLPLAKVFVLAARFPYGHERYA